MRSNNIQPDIQSTPTPSLETGAIEPEDDVRNGLDEKLIRLRPFIKKYYDLDDQDRDVVHRYSDSLHLFEKISQDIKVHGRRDSKGNNITQLG